MNGIERISSRPKTMSFDSKYDAKEYKVNFAVAALLYKPLVFGGRGGGDIGLFITLGSKLL